MEPGSAEAPDTRTDLYLVTATEGGPADGEYFDRAVVYAGSWQEAQEKVRAYIELCNVVVEESDAGLSSEIAEEGGAEYGSIAFDPNFIDVILLAENVKPPEAVDYESDGILVFSTWNDEEDSDEE
jgi:hypothetical protein